MALQQALAMAGTIHMAAQHGLYPSAPSLQDSAFEPHAEFGFDDTNSQDYLAMQANLSSLHGFNQEPFVYDPAGTAR